MKKVILLLLITSISLILGCENNEFSNKAIEQGKLALENNEYDKALSSFEIALDEGTDSLEIKELHDILKKYTDAESYLDNNDVKSAEETLDKINKNKEYAIKDDIDQLNNEVINLKKTIQEEKEIETPSDEIKSEESKRTIESQLNNTDYTKINKKNEYLQKASEIETQIIGLYESGIEYYEAAHKSCDLWDDFLNEIWAVLKDNLAKDEMAKLTNEQRQWIIDKEYVLGKHQDKHAEYIDDFVEITRGRCEELIERYMN